MEETADRAEAEGRAETVLGAAAWERPFEPVTGAGAVGAEWVVEVVNALPDVPSRRPARVLAAPAGPVVASLSPVLASREDRSDQHPGCARRFPRDSAVCAAVAPGAGRNDPPGAPFPASSGAAEAGARAATVSGVTVRRFRTGPAHGLGFYSFRAAPRREATGCGAVW